MAGGGCVGPATTAWAGPGRSAVPRRALGAYRRRRPLRRGSLTISELHASGGAVRQSGRRPQGGERARQTRSTGNGCGALRNAEGWSTHIPFPARRKSTVVRQRARGWGRTVAAGVVQAHLLPGEAWSETWSAEPWSETGAAIGPSLRRTDLNKPQPHRLTGRSCHPRRSVRFLGLPWQSRGQGFESPQLHPRYLVGSVLFLQVNGLPMICRRSSLIIF